MNWISTKDTSKLQKNHLYLIYGNQLKSHFPGSDIAVWDGEQFVDWDDREYYYRDYEVDFYMDVLKIPPPVTR